MPICAGYITPPGGPDIWWLDCVYPIFTAYVCLNGFALVFAVADICAVTFGPLLLIWRKDPSWRQQVVKVGLFHLGFSLASLLAAFAAAGFIAAGIGLPDPYCANVLCSEGGVRCSAFAYQNFQQIVPAGDRTLATTPHLRRILSPAVVKLNNGSFTFGGDSDVTCQDYTYISNYSRIVELHPDTIIGGIQDASHGSVTNSCLILLSESVFGIATSNNTYVDPSLDIKAPSPNPYAMWCTRDVVPVGLGWLPLKLQRAADWVGGLREQLNEKPIASGQGYVYNSTASCPDQNVFSHADVMLKDSVPAFQLLKGVKSPLHDNYTDDTYPTFFTSNDTEVDAILRSAVCQYALSMGWDARGVLSCPNTSMGIRSIGYPGDPLWPLGLAVYYPSLRYQCSGLINGTLCDYAGYPQSPKAYAVDEDGNFLKRKRSDAKMSVYVHLSINPTSTQIYWAVISMILVAGGAIIGTLLLLGCLPCRGLSNLHHLRGLSVLMNRSAGV